ncbi:MAG: hypothetical protein AAFU64_14165, partial [Bacteroidota bacterium]
SETQRANNEIEKLKKIIQGYESELKELEGEPGPNDPTASNTGRDQSELSSSSSIKEKANELIGGGKIIKALELLLNHFQASNNEENHKKINQLLRRYKDNESDVDQDIISRSEYNTEKSRITKAILNML